MSEFDRFWRELTERAAAAAEERRTDPQQELHQFVLQRMMARAFGRDPDSWLLKGGQTLLARFPDARATSDVDLIGIAGKDRFGMTADLNAALALDLRDHLTFEQISETPLMHGEAVRIGHRVRCGGRELFDLTTDLVPPDGRPFWVPPERIPFPEQLLRTGAEGEAPELLALSVKDQLAHKLSGMYMHGLRDLETKCVSCIPKAAGQWACQTGELPTRVQDLVDVAFLASKVELDAIDTHAMVQQDFHQRIAQGWPLDLPSRFRVPNPVWVPGYAKYAAMTPGLRQKTLPQAWPVVDRFVTPLLRPETPSGRWDPEEQLWAGQLPEHAAAYAEPNRQRILVVAHASGRSSGLGGLPVVSGELTTALAELDSTEVTLLTLDGAEPHGSARIVEIERPAQFNNTVHLLHISSTTWPDPYGLPPAGSDSYDVVIGHSRFSGPAAKNIRNRWYRFAKFVYVEHIPDQESAQVQGDPVRAAKYAERDKDLYQNADLVVGVGPLLTAAARTAEVLGGRQPSYHELIPGRTVRDAIPAPEPDGTFRILLSTHRIHDVVKGYPDLLHVVDQLRAEGMPIVLQVRGSGPRNRALWQWAAQQIMGRADVVQVLPFSTSEAELEADLRRADLVVMPSLIEGYGLVAAEATERGVPVLVSERSGYGQALLDPERFPAGAGESSVVRDAGLTGQQRVDAWKAALRAAAADQPARRAQAVELQAVQRQYTWENAAAAMTGAMAAANPGAQRYTVQAADGAIRLIKDAAAQIGAASGASDEVHELVGKFTGMNAGETQQTPDRARIGHPSAEAGYHPPRDRGQGLGH